MNKSIVGIADLPDELLLIIFNKLNPIDILYALVGVNQKLDKAASDIHFIRSINLMINSSNEENNSLTHAMLDRFCVKILP